MLLNKTVWSVWLFFFFSRKTFTLTATLDTLSSFVMHSCISASCVPWYTRVESVWLKVLSGWLSSLPAVVSSRSHSAEAAGTLEAGKHHFPSRLLGGLSLSTLTEPALRTDIASASRSSPSCCQPYFPKSITPEGSLWCRCLHTMVSSFGPVFSIPHKVRIPSFGENRSPNEGWFLHTDLIPAELVLLWDV